MADPVTRSSTCVFSLAVDRSLDGLDPGVIRKFRMVGLCSGIPSEGWRVVGFELDEGMIA